MEWVGENTCVYKPIPLHTVTMSLFDALLLQGSPLLCCQMYTWTNMPNAYILNTINDQLINVVVCTVGIIFYFSLYTWNLYV